MENGFVSHTSGGRCPCPCQGLGTGWFLGALQLKPFQDAGIIASKKGLIYVCAWETEKNVILLCVVICLYINTLFN